MLNAINQLKLSMLKLIKHYNKNMIELIGISQIKRIKITLKKQHSLSEKTVINDQLLFYMK